LSSSAAELARLGPCESYTLLGMDRRTCVHSAKQEVATPYFSKAAAMVEYDFDLITLGAGSGGTRASRISAQHYGAKVACVELPFGFVATDTVGGAGGT